MNYDDEFYRDILDGLCAYYNSSLISDLLTTINRMPAPGLGNAWNFNQITGKRWLVDKLAAEIEHGTTQILLLGGWYGILASLLLDHPVYVRTQITSLDLDPTCEAVALSVNQTHVKAGRFNALTNDMFDFDYNAWIGNAPCVIINTSCEHINAFSDWYGSLPVGPLLVLQSNDYFSCDEHVNCVESLEHFQQQAPLKKIKFSGELKLKKYTRFMLIGYK